ARATGGVPVVEAHRRGARQAVFQRGGRCRRQRDDGDDRRAQCQRHQPGEQLAHETPCHETVILSRFGPPVAVVEVRRIFCEPVPNASGTVATAHVSQFAVGGKFTVTPLTDMGRLAVVPLAYRMSTLDTGPVTVNST